MKERFFIVFLVIAQAAALQAVNELEEDRLRFKVREWEDSFGYKRKEYRYIPEAVMVDYLALVIAGNQVPSSANKKIITGIAQKKYKNGETMLHHASFLGKVNIAELLISYGALVDAQDRKGNTALHYAIDNRKLDFVMRLISHGAKIDIGGPGKSPWALALRRAQQYPLKQAPVKIIEMMSAASAHSGAAESLLEGVENEKCRQAIEIGRKAAEKYLKRASAMPEIDEAKFQEIRQFLDTLTWEC